MTTDILIAVAALSVTIGALGWAWRRDPRTAGWTWDALKSRLARLVPKR